MQIESGPAYKAYAAEFRAFAREVLGLEVPGHQMALLEKLGPSGVPEKLAVMGALDGTT